MTSPFFYYKATRLLVIYDWFNGGWSDPAYQLELESLGFPRVQAMLYRAPIPLTLPAITRMVFLAWLSALRYTQWEVKLTKQTPLWHGTWLGEMATLEGF